MYEATYADDIERKKLSFGPNSENSLDTATTFVGARQSPFKRTSTAQEAALDFTVMGLCNEFHGTSGSTVTHFVHWINQKYQTGPHLSSTTGNWSPGGATGTCRSQLGTILKKAVTHILNMDEFGLLHVQANVLDFLGSQHLTEIYNCISKALEKPPHKIVVATFVKDVLLKTSNVARMNRDKYIQASRTNEGDEKVKGQRWLKALLKYRLKTFAMALPSPSWIFDVSEDGFILRSPVPTSQAIQIMPKLPPWRTEITASSYSSSRPWHEPEVKKMRLTK